MSVRSVSNYIIFSFLFIFAATVFIRPAVKEPVPLLSDEIEEKTLSHVTFVIDAGHGGEDGGAEVGGILEKNINLDMSLKISDLCAIFGYSSRLTRSDDTLLYDRFDDLTDYSGKKKTYDLRNRLRIAEESDAELYIGIHMNKFPEQKYKGMQVWYSPNCTSGKTAAEYIRSYSKTYLDPSNERETKAAGKSIYILNRITVPAVLVECGFLSNDEERNLLLDTDYQSRVAAVIFSSCAEFVSLQ